MSIDIYGIMTEEKYTEQVLLRIGKTTKEQLEMAAKLDGMTSQEWIRKAIANRLSLMNICPSCQTVNRGNAKFCNECGLSLKDSKRTLYTEWLYLTLKDEFGPEGSELLAKVMDYIENPEREQSKLSSQGKFVVKEE